MRAIACPKETIMGANDAPNEETIRLAAPAGAAALVAIAGVVTLSLANNDAGDGQSVATTGYPAPQSGPALPGIAQNQTPGGQGSPELGVEIVVKFKDDAMVKSITDLFWRDQGAARTEFSSFKRNWPALAQMRLERVTYSNELVLVAAGNDSPQEMRALARRISQMPEVSYAEPNATAHPGGR